MKQARDTKEMKITVTRGAENPFREGSAVHKRAGAVLRANGKPVAAAIKAGARVSTVRYLEKAKVIRLK
jgi:hypothetical protein